MIDLKELTEREKDIYNDIVEGLGCKAICGKRYIERSTVSTYFNNIYKKLKAKGLENPRITLIVQYYKDKLNELNEMLQVSYCYSLIEKLKQLQAQYDKVVEQNRQLQAELRQKTAECEELKKALKAVGHLVEDALDAEETDDADKSLESLYKALDIISRAKDGEE